MSRGGSSVPWRPEPRARKLFEQIGINNVIRKSGLPASAVSVALLSLEMKRLIRQLPGKMCVRNN